VLSATANVSLSQIFDRTPFSYVARIGNPHKILTVYDLISGNELAGMSMVFQNFLSLLNLSKIGILEFSHID